MKIIKPMRLGVMTKPIVDSTQSYLAISGLLCFDMLDPETVLTEQSMWDSVTPILGSRGVLDAWTPKCHGEVLIWGEACSPKAIPTESMEVELKVGDLIRKKLTVHGDRYWQPTLTGAKLGKTEPFVRMPISYERAFGGNGYLQNPVGIGYDADKHILAGIPARLPNIEYSNNPILHPSQEPKPAAFMPTSLAWPGFGPGGTYDDFWKKYLSPAVPRDFNWSVFNVAPVDQRISGFFSGAESIHLQGMNAGLNNIEFMLPGFFMRSFTKFKNSEKLEESKAVLDSICLFPGLQRGILIFRAKQPLPRSADMQGIDSLMLACERKGEPRPLPHYENVFQLRTGNDRALHTLSDFQLMPRLSEAIEEKLEKRRKEAEQERLDLSLKKDQWFKVLAASAVGFDIPDGFFSSSKPIDIPFVTDLEAKEGTIDLAKLFSAVTELSDKYSAEAEAHLNAADIELEKLNAQIDLVDKARKSGDYKLLAEKVYSSNSNSNPKLAEFIELISKIASRMESEPAWPMAAAIKQIDQFSQQDALVQLKQYSSELSEKDQESLSQAMTVLESEDVAASAETEATEPRNRFIETLRQIANAFNGKGDLPDNYGGFFTDKQDVNSFDSLITSIDAASVKNLDVDKLFKNLGKSFLTGKTDQIEDALKEFTRAVPKFGDVPEVNFSNHFGQGNPVQDEIFQKLGQEFTKPPDIAALRTALRDSLEFSSATKAISDSNDSHSIETLAQIEQAKSDTVERVGRVAPGLVKDKNINWEKFLDLMDLSEPTQIEPPPTTNATAEAGEAFALRRARFLALGADGFYRLSDEIPPETEAEQHANVLLNQFYADAVGNSQSNLMASAFLNAISNASANGNVLDDSARQRIADELISHSKELNSLGSLEEKKSKMDQMQALAMMSATLGTSVMRKVIPEGEQMLRDGRKRSPVPLLKREEFTQAIATQVGVVVRQEFDRGSLLAARDLAGADLRGLNLVGVDFTGAFLEFADLRGADLSGSKCEGAVFTGALLDGAKFCGAILNNANLSQVHAHRADFSSAHMCNVNMFEADFSEGNFSHAIFDKCNALKTNFISARFDSSTCDAGVFIEANFAKTAFRKALWHKAIFIKVDLRQCVAQYGTLKECVFAESNLDDADFSYADIDGFNAVKSSLRGFNAHAVTAQRSGWAQCDLTGANFSSSDIEHAGFMDALVCNADFSSTNSRRAMFLNTKLRGTNFSKAQLYEACMRGADLTGACLRMSNLHLTEFTNAVLDGCDMTGARNIGTILEMPSAEA